MNPDNLSAGDWFFGSVLRMGANWKATVSGIGSALFMTLTFLALIPYEVPELGNMFSPKVKAILLSAGIFASGVLKIWNSFVTKSRNVTGGSTQQTLSGNIVDPGKQTLVDQTLKATVASGEIVTPQLLQVSRSLDKNK